MCDRYFWVLVTLVVGQITMVSGSVNAGPNFDSVRQDSVEDFHGAVGSIRWSRLNHGAPG